MKRINPPIHVDLDVTNNCNLRCSYCYHFSSPGDVGMDLSTEEWLKFFYELQQCKVLRVDLSGGEPFLRNDCKELINGIVQNKMRFSIVSNGTLISEDIVEYLKSTNRCDSVQVSIDGAVPEEHDACRGKGNFEKALVGLRCLMKYEIPTTVRVTVHRYNFRSLDKIAKLLLEDIGLSSFSTNNAGHMGLCQKNKDDVQLTTEEYAVAMDILLKCDKKYSKRINGASGPLASVKCWTKMEEAKREKKENLPECGYLRSCGGVFVQMAVLADGTMVPCTQLSHIKLGKINQDSLLDVWFNHPELKRLRERCNISLNNFECCTGCEYVSYCQGGCPALAYALTGDENKPSPDSCYKMFLEGGGKLPTHL
jgi:SynChlorMet cassette radical SAM/SPASM protein ScmE